MQISSRKSGKTRGSNLIFTLFSYKTSLVDDYNYPPQKPY